MLRNLPQLGFGIHDVQISSRDSTVIGQYLHSKWGASAAIREFQEGIREKQLLARHKKETDPWDAAMALVPPLPKDWVRWVSKVGVERNYMFYRYQRGGAKLATAAIVTAKFRFGSRSTMRLPDAPDAEERCSSNPSARWAGCAQGEISCI